MFTVKWFLSIIHSFTEGFATVHKGLDRLNNSFVAIKEVDKTHYSPTDSSLEREVYILSEVPFLPSSAPSKLTSMQSKVQHSNVVKLICTYVTPSKVFIVTELAAGGELLERSTYSLLIIKNILRISCTPQDYRAWQVCRGGCPLSNTSGIARGGVSPHAQSGPSRSQAREHSVIRQDPTGDG